MYYVVETEKSFDQASADLDASVKANNFGVLYVHDLGNTFRGKGIDFSNDCKVFEVCNPVYGSQVLSIDMNLNMALPCRISVFTENGKTKIGLIKPTGVLESLTQDPKVKAIAEEVEAKLIKMIDEAK